MKRKVETGNNAGVPVHEANAKALDLASSAYRGRLMGNLSRILPMQEERFRATLGGRSR